MILNTYTIDEIKRAEGLNPDEPCFNIHKSKTDNGHFWTCGNSKGPVTQQVDIQEVIDAIPNVAISEIVDEITGDVVLVLHIISSRSEENTIVKF